MTFKSEREIYKALLDGKTIETGSGIKIKLDSQGDLVNALSGTIIKTPFFTPSQWKTAKIKRNFEKDVWINIYSGGVLPSFPKGTYCFS